MSLGLIALIMAAMGAGWLLWRLGRQQGAEMSAGGARNVTMLKAVIWLGLAAVLLAAKLWPLAFMVLLAAGGVSAIELWRDRAVREDAAANAAAKPPTPVMDASEAARVLGVAENADAAAIRAAHKKLIAQIHPDKGGTDYLAAKINEARDVMLGEVETLPE